jgi:SulP family sulfate permease
MNRRAPPAVAAPDARNRRARRIPARLAARRPIPVLLVYRYDSALFFANAEDFRRRAPAPVAQQAVPLRRFVLNAEAKVEVDISALDAVDELRRELAHQGAVFALARVGQDLLADLEAYGLVDSVGTDHIFPTLPTAVDAYRKWSGTTGQGTAGPVA